MALNKGYKQSEAGVIPVDWEAAPLGRHATFKTGPFGSLLHKSDYVDCGIPIVNPMQIVDGRILPTQSMAISADAARKLSSFRLTPGDVVIGRRGEMGRCAFVRARESGWLCGTGSMVISCHSTLGGEYLQRVLSSSLIVAAIENASVGTTMVNLNNSTLANLRIPLPPTKAEQEAIAGALSDADAWIESLEQLIAKKRQIKQGAMQELLTCQTRLPGFNGKWETKRLGGLIDLLTGFPFQSRGYSKSGVRLLRGSNVKRNRTDWSDDITQYWPEVTTEIRHYLLRVNDIVVAMDGSLVGRSFTSLKANDVPSLLLQRVARVRAIGISQSYLKEWICSSYFTEHCDAVKTTTAIPHISPADIKSFNIPIPPTLAEQSAIATILSDMDAEIESLETKLTKARQIKQGMMQELLTGRTRLVNTSGADL